MQLRQNIYTHTHTHTLALRSIMVNLPLRLAVHLAVEMTALPTLFHTIRVSWPVNCVRSILIQHI